MTGPKTGGRSNARRAHANGHAIQCPGESKPEEQEQSQLRSLFPRRKTKRSEIALVTANFSGIDDLKALPVRDGIDAFYYTDAATAAAASPEAAATWTRVMVPNYPRHDFNPRLRGRYFKHQIHRLDEVREHRWLVWADSSLLFHDLGFVKEQAAALARLPVRRRVLLVPHPDRQTIWEEFQFIESQIDAGDNYLILRYRQEKMAEQMEYFRSRRWSLHARLWCGTIWMIENAEPLRRAWDAWWDQNLRFGMMDQLSLPVILDDHGIEPQAFAVMVEQNEYFSCVPHSKDM
jgi:hypothetical protein